LHVTYHHNDWQRVNSRLPSLRFGTGHIYSSCFNGGISGVNSRMGAQVLVENNSFTGVERAVVTNLDSDEEGYANERNNVFSSSTTQITKKVGRLTFPWHLSMSLIYIRVRGLLATSTPPTLLLLCAALLRSLLVLGSLPSKQHHEKYFTTTTTPSIERLRSSSFFIAKCNGTSLFLNPLFH
jgi:hypothetical protein